MTLTPSRGERQDKMALVIAPSDMAAVALNYFAYNFRKIRRTLRITPAMTTGVVPRLDCSESDCD